MHMPPLVSVVIINHNYGRYLPECINSALSQTYPNIEIIVVDDGSTDHSLDVLRAYSGCICGIRQNNAGPSAARNAGIRRSRGEWVAFLDADDIWRPDKLEKQSKWFQEPSVGMVFCGLEHMDDSGLFLSYSLPIPASDILATLVTFAALEIGGGSTAVVRTACLRELGGFDETLSSAMDLDLWIRIAAQHEIRAIPTALVKYRIHSGSISSNLELFETNNHRVLTKVFANPACARVHHLRRQAFGRFYMILAGSHFRRRSVRRAIAYASTALVYWPSEIVRLLGLPLRTIRRLGSSIRSAKF